MTELREAATLSKKGGEMLLRIISPGRGSSGTYPTETIEAAGTDRVFRAGLPMFVDHQSVTENMDRPEGSLRNLAGVLTEDAYWDGEGLVARAKIFEHWKPILTDMHENIGVSIRASGEVAESDHGPVITRLCEAQSVDFVTQAGRGGKILEVLESKRDPVALIEEVTEALVPHEGTMRERVEGLQNAVHAINGRPSKKLEHSSITTESVAAETSQPPAGKENTTQPKEATMATETGRVDEAQAPTQNGQQQGQAPQKSAEALQAENERLKAQISSLQQELAKLKQGGKQTEAARIYTDAFREAGANAPDVATALAEAAAAGDDDLNVAALTESARTQAAQIAAAQGKGTPMNMGDTTPIHQVQESNSLPTFEELQSVKGA